MSYAEFEYSVHGNCQGVIKVLMQDEKISTEEIAQIIAKKIRVILPDDFNDLSSFKGCEALRWLGENFGVSYQIIE